MRNTTITLMPIEARFVGLTAACDRITLNGAEIDSAWCPGGRYVAKRAENADKPAGLLSLR